MGTAISRKGALGLGAALAIAVAVAGCGAASTPATRSTSVSSGAGAAAEPPTTIPSFAWLKPSPAPAGWRVVRIPTGAALPYPPGWQLLAGDRGTATAVLMDSRHRYAGYLNVTPQQGSETLSDWPKFRVGHNADEGDRKVVTLATGSGLRFRMGHGSCVRDAYTTSTGNRYVELACLVAGSRTSAVIVGAAPPHTWAAVSPSIERAIDSFTA
ncbi:MAG: hypothetical protein JO039_14130 [Solirubrobacterales bacterium]|nr:hypothetical protein [Solirubrobacterales bacterium]